MKNRILEALKTKFEGVDASVLNRVADKLAKNVLTDEQLTTAVGDFSWAKLLESYGDSRANEAVKTAVSNYESKYNLKDGKALSEPTPTPILQQQLPPPTVTTAPDNVDTIKLLTERIAQLNEAVTAISTQRVNDTRRQRLDTAIAKLPTPLRRAYERTPLSGSDDEFENLMTGITTEIDAIMQDSKQKGAVFGRPQNGSGIRQGELTKEQLAAISNRGAIDKDAQPF